MKPRHQTNWGRSPPRRINETTVDPNYRPHEHYTLEFWNMDFVSAAELAEAICTMQGIRDGAFLLKQERLLAEHFGDPIDKKHFREILAVVRKLTRDKTKLLGAQLGARITAARKAKGLTPSELASQAGLRKDVLLRIEETGRVRQATLERLAQELETTPDELRYPPEED